MSTSKLTGKDLKAIGYPEGRLIGIAQRLMEQFYRGKRRQFKLEMLKRVMETPEYFLKHEHLSLLANEILAKSESKKVTLKKGKLPYAIYGVEGIEAGALQQMEVAMKLPITVAGALMPDAHLGYGLPIGGVLATENAVIPYGVGVDIGCRMCLSIFDVPPAELQERKKSLKSMLIENTRFGHAAFKHPMDDPVLERQEFNEIPVLRTLKDKAREQVGTSGGGNHFVEFGVVNIPNEDNVLQITPGQYLALLSHSGSRGLGASIARHYTKLAMEICKLPSGAKQLAWLDLDTEAGQEYWQSMSLAGDYASACHHQIHFRMADALGITPISMVENHHNFAWKEKNADGSDIIVHRKGATPATLGVLGIIPGSMSSEGFIVQGKGAVSSINSAAHGAGRLMSRTKAKATLSKKEVQKKILDAGIELIGSGLDEAPMVYKDIHRVMEAQKDLVEIVGTFMPNIVRMCGDERFIEVD